MEVVDLFKVEVATTNGARNEFTPDNTNYYPCVSGLIYVTTNNPGDIFTKWGQAVLSVTRVGMCYQLFANLHTCGTFPDVRNWPG